MGAPGVSPAGAREPRNFLSTNALEEARRGVYILDKHRKLETTRDYEYD
jgi:hypothetical protein